MSKINILDERDKVEYSTVTQDSDGLMSSTDKKKIDTLALNNVGGDNKTTITLTSSEGVAAYTIISAATTQNAGVMSVYDKATIDSLPETYLGKEENAVSATKLNEARTINGVKFDGTEDVIVPLDTCILKSTSTSLNWHKIADIIETETSVTDTLVLYVNHTAYSLPTFRHGGILKLSLKVSDTGGVSYAGISWLLATEGILADDFVLIYKTGSISSAELWVKQGMSNDRWTFSVLTNANSNKNPKWNIYDSIGDGSESYDVGTGTVIKSSILGIKNTNESDSGWLTLASNVKYRKINNLVEIRGTYEAPNSSGGLTIGTMPEGYRPSNDTVYNTNSATANDATEIYYTLVNTSGTVVISSYNASVFTKGNFYSVNIMYMIG